MRIVSKNSEDQVVKEKTEQDNTPLPSWSSQDIVSIINAILLGLLAVKVSNLFHKFKQLEFQGPLGPKF